MENLEKEFSRSGYAKSSKKFESFPANQKRPNINIGRDALKKEFAENSFGKVSMLELLVDTLVVNLDNSEYAEIIDRALGEEGAAKNLADEIWQYAVKFGSGSEKIDVDNNAKDLINHFETSIVAFAKRTKNKELSPDYQKIQDYQKIIAKDFNSLRDYFHLLQNNRDFEMAEIGSRAGYLAGKIKKEDLLNLKRNKAGYIEKCKDVLGLRDQQSFSE